MRPLGVNTWVWTSPLTDANAPELLRHVADLGFDAVELPLESVGDLSAAALRPVLADTGLVPCVVGAMAPGRDLVAAPADQVRGTQDYLRSCVDLAHEIGAAAVCGPFTAVHRPRLADEPDRAGGGVRRAADPPGARRRARRRGRCADRHRAAQPLRDVPGQHRGPGADRARPAARQPRRSRRSLGLALDTYHLNIEERSSADAVRAAGDHLVHVQVCGSDRGAPGGDQTDWPALLAALDEVGYDGPLVLESFTADNASIATAASIWRPLAPTQDDLARDGLAFLRHLSGAGAPTPGGSR